MKKDREYNSGKSSKALKIASRKDNVLYLSLDGDQSLSKIAERYKNIELQFIKNCFLIDIEFSLIGKNGKANYKTVVIDSINFIKSSNLHDKLNLGNIIKGLEYLHYTYNIDIIATYNILRKADKMSEMFESVFFNKNDWEITESVL